MKFPPLLSVRPFAALALSVGVCSMQAATVVLPESAALPLGTSSQPGFAIRVAQGPVDPPLANNSLRALAQIHGLLTDDAGVPVANEAVAGPGSGGSYNPKWVCFEKEGDWVDLYDLDANYLGGLPPDNYTQGDFFPGIPGTGGHTDNFVVEAVGFLELAAGEHTLAVSVAADRTDVNNDDGFQVFVSENPRDYFGMKVAEYQRIAPGFEPGWRNENQFTVQAPVAGLYPFRILYWQTGLAANLNFYSIDSVSGMRIPVGDDQNAGAIKVYSSTSVAAARGPYVVQISPSDGSEGNPAVDPVSVTIADGAATVAVGDVRMFIDGEDVSGSLEASKNGGLISAVYYPDAGRTDSVTDVRVEYTDSLGTVHEATWSFGILTAEGGSTTVAGQWDFDRGDLRATVGRALAYLDGAGGLTEQGTRFGTTTELGIAGIGGEEALVMEAPGDLDRRIGYVMTHGIGPNGGGTRVNQYTLIMDVMVDTTGAGAAALWQTSSAGNTDDGDLFWQGNNFGQGGGGYNGRGTFTAGEWHRVVAAYDMAANPPVVTKYVDGIKQDDWIANQSLDNPRRSLQETAILLADGDQDERRRMWLNSVQIRVGKLSDAEAAALGGPSATGIPSRILADPIAGQWDFAFGDLGANVGKALSFLDGEAGQTAAGTEFGSTTELGIAGIQGEEAMVMRVPGDLSRNIGYVMEHGIAPNGGGTLVNQYTLVMDVMVATTGSGAAALWQTSSTGNTDDGDLFWQGNNFGQGGGGYNGRGTFTAGEWHRIVAAYDMAANPPLVAKFVDGIKQDDWTANQGLDNPRRALQATAVLFGDGDQDERREMWVNSVQIRPGRITDAEAVLLGGPSASGIPLYVPKSNVTGQWDFEFADLGATIGVPLDYLDGAAGQTATGTSFGATADLGVGDIAGLAASIMEVPGDLSRNIGYVMTHRISPNGGGTRVNQYTLIMDVMVDTTGSGAAALWQVSSADNTDDGDLFWQGNNFGQGAGGYNGTGAFTAGEWHRIAAAYDMAANPPVVTKYVDGIKQDDWTANQSLDNPRRSMGPTAVLFGDGDQDERRRMWVSSVQIRSAKLTDAELESLGGATADGIPIVLSVTVVPEPVVTFGANGDGTVTLSWEADAAFTLESASDLSAPVWNTVPGVSGNSVTITTDQAAAYYRLRQ